MKKALVPLVLVFCFGLLVPFGRVFATETQVGTPLGDTAVSNTDTTSSATDTRSQLRQSIASQREAIQSQKQALSAQRCTLVETKVDLQVTKFENNLQRRQAFFHRFANRLQNFISKLDANGYDTTKLKADLVILNEKITKYASDKTHYIALLKQTRSYTCGKSEGEFRAKLLEAKNALETARLSNLDVRTFYQTTIRPDIKALKQQVKASKNSTDSDATIPTTTDGSQTTSDDPQITN